jgi:very-short-patch-repair endonuclease
MAAGKTPDSRTRAPANEAPLFPSPASGRGAGERAPPQARKAKRIALGKAKALRSNQTDAELRLWYHLRAGRLLGLKFKRQHPLGPYIVDFVCLTHHLIVEADGGQHNESQPDLTRDAFLSAQGFRVLRFWNDSILKETDAVLESIRLAVGEAPSPLTPLPQAGEGNRN